jgi:hypothetical protein
MKQLFPTVLLGVLLVLAWLVACVMIRAVMVFIARTWQ